MTKSRANFATLREVIAKQRALGRRLNWLLAVPLVITGVMASMFFTLNQRLKDVELGAKLVTIERFLVVDNNIEWAENQYENLANSSPSAAILARLGILYFRLDPDTNEAKAVEYLERAKHYDEKNWEIYRNLTFIYTQTGRCEKAIEAGLRATALNDRDANSWNNLSWNYYKCAQPFHSLNKARMYAERAVNLTNKNNAQFLDTLAQVYGERGEHDLARESIRRAIAIAPNEQLQGLKGTFKKLFPDESLAESKEARR
jgi:tetratricopeptide (TPR) repeat protein